MLNCSLWCLYAVPLVTANRNLPLICNTVGTSFQLFYLLVYLAFCKRRAYYGAVVLATLLVPVTAALLMLVVFPQPVEYYTTGLGVAATVLNIFMYASPLTIIGLVVRTRSVEYMPLPITLACGFCSCSWVVYGIYVGDIYITTVRLAGSGGQGARGDGVCGGGEGFDAGAQPRRPCWRAAGNAILWLCHSAAGGPLLGPSITRSVSHTRHMRAALSRYPHMLLRAALGLLQDVCSAVPQPNHTTRNSHDTHDTHTPPPSPASSPASSLPSLRPSLAPTSSSLLLSSPHTLFSPLSLLALSPSPHPLFSFSPSPSPTPPPPSHTPPPPTHTPPPPSRTSAGFSSPSSKSWSTASTASSNARTRPPRPSSRPRARPSATSSSAPRLGAVPIVPATAKVSHHTSHHMHTHTPMYNQRRSEMLHTLLGTFQAAGTAGAAGTRRFTAPPRPLPWGEGKPCHRGNVLSQASPPSTPPPGSRPSGPPTCTAFPAFYGTSQGRRRRSAPLCRSRAVLDLGPCRSLCRSRPT